jgi:uncharacterized protein (DUF362 family)
MKIHPLLHDQNAVIVIRLPVTETPTWQDFSRIAIKSLEIMQLDLAGKKVVLKPNATVAEHYKDPGSGIGTHPGFIAGMAEYCKTHGVKPGGIYVLEDPRNSDDNLPRHWKETGYLEVAEQTGAKLRCPTSYTCVRKVVPKPLEHPWRNVSRLAVASDSILINVPKLKTHNLGITTLGMKNLMGVDLVFERHYCAQAIRQMPGYVENTGKPNKEWMTREMHEEWQAGLARRLVDLAQVVVPQLNVVEGVVGRDGTGFNRGRNFTLGLVVAGINMVSVDSVTSYLMGFDPQQLIYLKMAAAAGLGQNDITKLSIFCSEGGEPVICTEPEKLRLNPPFQVISDILE